MSVCTFEIIPDLWQYSYKWEYFMMKYAIVDKQIQSEVVQY